MAGCAGIVEKQTADLKVEVEKENIVSANDSDKKTAISPQVLYLLMTAEIARQRGQYELALDSYLQVAKQVNAPIIAEQAAKIAVFLKDLKKTDEAVSIWLKQDEKSLQARKIAVLSAVQRADKKSAVKYLNMILKDNPAGFEPTLMELVAVLTPKGAADFIFKTLEVLAKQHQDKSVIFFVQALLAELLNQPTLAKEKVDKALELQPEWDKALLLQAQIALRNDNFELAKEILEKVLEKTPDNGRARKMLAQILIQAKAYDDAVDLYQAILEIKPNDEGSHFAIALIYLQQEKLEEATHLLHKLIDKPAWEAKASFHMGRIEFKKAHFANALVWFDKASQGPYGYDASMASVTVLLQQKNFVEAESRLIQLLKSYPQQAINILLSRADIYNEQKKFQQAFVILSHGLKQFPEHRELLYTRALIAERLDKLDVLEADLKKILRNNPDDANALNTLGYTLVDRTERYREAKEYLLKAVKLKPEEAAIIDSLGWLLFKQGEKTEALKQLRHAYKIQPDSEIAAHLTEVLWKLEHKNEARQLFTEALKKSPDNESLLKLKKKFLHLNQQ